MVAFQNRQVRMKVVYNTLQRYAVVSLLTAFAVITTILSGIVWLSQSMRILDLIVNRGISFIDFFKVAIMMLPSLLFFLLPITYLLAVVYLVYKIRQDRELVILKSIGLSDKNIITPIFMVGCVIALFGWFNSIYLMPVSHAKFKDMNDYFQNEYATLLLQEKTFNTQGKLTVYLDSKNKDGTLNGVFISDAREEGKQRIISAAHGKVKATESGPVFELSHGTQQETDVYTNKVSMLSFDRYIFNIKKLPVGHANRPRSPVELTVPEIIRNMPSNPEDRKTYYAALHQRLTWPFFILSLPLLAAIVLVGAKYQRRYQVMQYVKCLMVCSSFMVLSILSINRIHSGLWWIAVLYLVTATPFVVSVSLLRRHDNEAEGL